MTNGKSVRLETLPPSTMVEYRPISDSWVVMQPPPGSWLMHFMNDTPYLVDPSGVVVGEVLHFHIRSTDNSPVPMRPTDVLELFSGVNYTLTKTESASTPFAREEQRISSNLPCFEWKTSLLPTAVTAILFYLLMMSLDWTVWTMR